MEDEWMEKVDGSWMDGWIDEERLDEDDSAD